ncbi:MAG: hypothetical protein ACOCVG_03080 [Verrucomicrobiota bacterium]
MAYASRVLIRLLEETADRLESGADYSWSHMGRCNCGHLAQTVTKLHPAEIHRRALVKEACDWSEISEHPRQYCPSTGYPFDHIVDALSEMGLSAADLRALENLSDRKVLKALPGGFRWLQRNRREDLILYLRTWSNLMRREVAERQADREATAPSTPTSTPRESLTMPKRRRISRSPFALA